MLPGRLLTPAGMLSFLWRRKLMILLPLIVGMAGAVFYARRLPNEYQAETLILVVPQRVPETFIRSTVTMRIEDRLRTISQQILSRTRLEQIIQEFNLYPELRAERPMDDVVAHMRERVGLNIVRGDSFRLTYTYSEPTATMKVTDRLAKDFITDNTRERQAQAEGTSQFLEAQLGDARQRLIEQEKRLEAYRRQHAGQLPSQLASNLQIIQNTQLQLTTLHDNVNRHRDRRVVVDRMLSELAVVEAAPPPAPPVDPNAAAQLPVERQLELARQRVSELTTRGLTSQHPDVRAAERKVKELEATVAETRPKQPASEPVVRNAADLARRNQIVQLTAERDNLDRQIASFLVEEQRLQAQISQYQARVDAVPSRESEMTELTRDYDTLQTTYRTLLAKKEESQIATNLESREIGEKFRVIDAARVPEEPIAPNRTLIHVGGVFAGLVLGLALSLLLELRNTAVATPADVVDLLDLPVLAMVPIVVTTTVTRPSRLTRLLRLGVGVLCVIVAVAAAVLWKGWF